VLGADIDGYYCLVVMCGRRVLPMLARRSRRMGAGMNVGDKYGQGLGGFLCQVRDNRHNGERAGQAAILQEVHAEWGVTSSGDAISCHVSLVFNCSENETLPG